MILKMREGETLVIYNQDNEESFIVLEAKDKMIYNVTDCRREKILTQIKGGIDDG